MKRRSRQYRVPTCLSVAFALMLSISSLLTPGLSLAAPSPNQSAVQREERVEPELLALAQRDPNAEFSVIVRAGDPAPQNKREDTNNRKASHSSEKVKEHGGRPGTTLAIIGGSSGKLKGKDILTLNHDPSVDRVSLDREVLAFDDLRSVGTRTVNSPTLWPDGIDGRGVTVAVLDSGVYAHPDISSRIVANVDFTAAPANGDPGGHGTHVAGIIAGNGTSSNGAYKGVAPRANIANVRVLDANGSSSYSTVIRGLQWVVQNRNAYNIRVVNLSLGATAPVAGYRTDPLAAAVEIVWFSGVVVVTSAGNTGPNSGTITLPGSDPFVITVGAMDDRGTSSLSDDVLAGYSSQGPTPGDNFHKPDLVAPGRRIVSLRSPGSTLDTAYAGWRVSYNGDTNYFQLSGTSMAAPFVSGVAALLAQKNPRLVPSQIKYILKNRSPRSISGYSTDEVGKGYLDAKSALDHYGTTSKENQGLTPAVDFARDVRPLAQGMPLVWRSSDYHNGVDSRGTRWSNITWDNITWDNITWDNITWENITWDNITWTNITWDNITWDNITWDASMVAGSTGNAFKLLGTLD